MFDRFEVIPAVDVKDGQAVQLVGGDPEHSESYGDPTAAAQQWVDAGAAVLHLVDLDGAFEGDRKNAGAIEAIVDAVDVTVHVGGGIRTVEDALSLLDRGVDRVILGTAAVEEPSIVEEISNERPESVLVSLDARDGQVVVEGWTSETELTPAAAAGRYADLGAAGILYTDIDVEGQLTGVRAERVEEIVTATDLPVIASGGVSSIKDLTTLRDAGATGAVVGSALYQGHFTLETATRVLH